jgi:hypothetical protein
MNRTRQTCPVSGLEIIWQVFVKNSERMDAGGQSRHLRPPLNFGKKKVKKKTYLILFYESFLSPVCSIISISVWKLKNLRQSLKAWLVFDNSCDFPPPV